MILTPEVCEQAVAMLEPSILAQMESGAFKRRALHIVIADPHTRPGNMGPVRWLTKGILFERSFGDVVQGELSFKDIARSKCYLSWRHGLSSHHIQTRTPHLLQPGDTVFWGSAVSDGLVVAASGVQPYFDEMVSSWVLAACQALCIKARETAPNNGQFFV